MDALVTNAETAPTGAVCFTFDFDAEEVWLADQADAATKPSVLSQGHYGAKRGVDAVLERLRRYDVRATFFVPGRVAERHPAVFERILEGGHEIAHHGYTHREPALLTEDEEREELQAGLDALTRRGAEVFGYRAPGWAVSLRTHELLTAAGFFYSSNMMDDIRPYRHLPSELIEVPVHWSLDDAPFLWFSTADWTRTIVPNTVLQQVLQSEAAGILEAAGVCTFTFHPQLIGRPGRLPVLESLLAWSLEGSNHAVITCHEAARTASPAEVHRV